MTALSSEYPDVELSHMYVDNAAMQLIRNPKQVLFTLSKDSLNIDWLICARVLAY